MQKQISAGKNQKEKKLSRKRKILSSAAKK